MKVLIVDERYDRAAITAARALAANGWTVGSASWAPSLTAQSKAATEWRRVVHTADGDEAFLEGLNEAVVQGGYEVAFVTWERAVRAVSEYRDKLGFPVYYGPHEGVLLAMDKELLPAVAAKAGLGVPHTIRADPETLADWRGPVVIKNAWAAEINVRGRRFDSGQEAVSHAKFIDASGGRAIAQEMVAGQLAAMTLVSGPDGIVSLGQQRSELVWPQPIGSTARGVSVDVDPELLAPVKQLISDLRWQGIAHLEFMVSPDGESKLIDFNPRYYGSMALAIRSGANHPDTWARLATGRPVTPTVGRPGARYQWLSRDLRASVAAPHPVGETARCLAAAPTAVHSIWSWSEPTLAPRFLLQQVGRRIQRKVPSVARVLSRRIAQ